VGGGIISTTISLLSISTGIALGLFIVLFPGVIGGASGAYYHHQKRKDD